nr:host specificity factor TipJ family phage tail protein [Halomonas alkaliphila]
MPSIPTPNANGGIEQGSQINDPSTTINRPRLNGVINQIAGQVKVAPYYLAPPHTYFIDPRTKAVDILLCVTWGPCLLPPSQIRIAETPVTAFGDDVNFQVFQPGENITGHSANQLWYNAPEVGAASNGQAGLKLKRVFHITERLPAPSINVNGNQISVTGPHEIPADWEPSLLLNVRVPRQIELQPPAPGEVRAVLSGSFADLGLVVGDAVEIHGDALRGSYIVASVTSNALTLSYPDLTPVTDPTGGVYQLTIDKEGARYRVVSRTTNSIVVEKLLVDSNVDTAWLGWDAWVYRDRWNVFVDSTYAQSEWLGPFPAQKAGTVIDRAEITTLAVRGMGYANENGVDYNSQWVELQWREIGSEDWQWLGSELGGASRDQLGFTTGIDFDPPAAVEFRYRRMNPENTDMAALEELHWTGLSGRLANSPVKYDDITVLALTIVGSDAIAAQSENRITCVPTAILKRMDGTVGPTRSAIDFVRNAANQSGISDDEINMQAMQRIDDITTARGDTFDYNNDSDDTVKNVLERALSAVWTQLTWDEVLTPVRDEPRTDLGHMYSPQNMRADALLTKTIRAVMPDDYDAVDVEYDSAITGVVETVECRISNDPPTRVETIRIEGVRDETRAWRHGMRRLMRHLYVRKGYTWGTTTDLLNSNKGDYLPVVGPIPNRAQSALIEHVQVADDGVHMIVNEALNWGGIEQHVIFWRNPEGESSKAYEVTRGESDYHVIAGMGGDPVPVVDPTKEPPHLLFGRVEHVLIKSITPSGMSNVNATADGYDERVYQYDDEFPDD